MKRIDIFKHAHVISNKQKVRKLEKQRTKEVLSISLEKVFAEITDYSNTLKENQLQYIYFYLHGHILP